MARMLGIHASIIRGSIGGNTFLAGPDHQIIVRQRTSPVNPQTTRQTQMRGDFSGAAAKWNALTDIERRAWALYAESVVIPNPVNPIHPTGRQLFVGNVGTRDYLITRGLIFASVVDTAPPNPGRLVVEGLQITAPDSPFTGFTLHVTNPNPELIKLYAFVSPPQNPARNRYQGVFDTESLADVDLGAATGTIDFTIGADDDVYFVRTRMIVQTGEVRTSAEYVLRAVVSTTII